MNAFQKWGVFLLRLLGTCVVFFGLASPIVITALGLLHGINFSILFSGQWFESIIWSLVGLLLLLLAKPLGRWLGQGLE